jgi:hypothetical protein
MYNDNEYKFVAVLNKKIDLSKLLNALGHITAGLVDSASDLEEMKFIGYQDADGGIHPRISNYPFIVLVSDNGNQIRNLRKSAIEEKLLYNDFTNTMLGSSSQDQQDKTKSTKEQDLEYFAIVLFGNSEKLNPLTKKFSLFK